MQRIVRGRQGRNRSRKTRTRRMKRKKAAIKIQNSFRPAIKRLVEIQRERQRILDAEAAARRLEEARERHKLRTYNAAKAKAKVH